MPLSGSTLGSRRPPISPGETSVSLHCLPVRSQPGCSLQGAAWRTTCARSADAAQPGRWLLGTRCSQPPSAPCAACRLMACRKLADGLPGLGAHPPGHLRERLAHDAFQLRLIGCAGDQQAQAELHRLCQAGCQRCEVCQGAPCRSAQLRAAPPAAGGQRVQLSRAPLPQAAASCSRLRTRTLGRPSSEAAPGRCSTSLLVCGARGVSERPNRQQSAGDRPSPVAQGSLLPGPGTAAAAQRASLVQDAPQLSAQGSCLLGWDAVPFARQGSHGVVWARLAGQM